MNDAYTLLNINKDILQDFYLQAAKVGDHQTEKVINQNVRKLRVIEERMFVDEGIKVSKQSIDEILYKVVETSKSGVNNIDDWTVRELRIVSYYLMKLQNDDNVYNYALTLLDKGWRNMFFKGLVFYVLNSWNMIKPEMRKNTCQLIVRKLQQYTDNNRRYLMLKNHANFFDEAGPTRMATLLLSKNQDVREAPMTLGNKPATFSQYYYSDVIVKYYEKANVDIDNLEEVFKVHDVARTKKLVFANLVEAVDKSADVARQTQISKFINRILGDVTLASTWAPFPGATAVEAQKLKHAMQLVNLWFARRIIETFFEVCVQDRERKDFWLRYVDYVSGFKIIGSTLTMRTLQSDSRVSSMFQRHFVETNSRYSQTAALVLCIKNKVIVEFSDTGALYVYNQGHNQTKFLRNGARYMNSTNDLKIPSMNSLIEISDWGYNYYYDEGRMTHQGHWATRLSGWMQDKVLSSNNTSISYFDTKDDETFTAKPLPKEEEIKKPSSVQRSLFDDVPEYLQSQTSKATSRPEPKPTATVTPKTTVSTTPTYESNVSISISSKWFFNDKYRVVCNRKGFYLNISRGQRFIYLRSLMDEAMATGSIWIKRPTPSEWTPIVHSTSGRELYVGYVKEAGGGILFKQEQNQSDYMNINLY